MQANEFGHTTRLVDGPRWYAVMSQPHKERVAAANLAAQGFESFCPLIQRTRRHARRTEIVLRPLFAAYLFVQLDLGRDRWRSVLGTFGVRALIMDGRLPLPVPKGLVETLAASINTEGGLAFEAELTPDQQVEIVKGPFDRQIGRLQGLDAEGRAEVLLEILGSERIVAMSRRDLMPISA